jgi:hypothetical protein
MLMFDNNIGYQQVSSTFLCNGARAVNIFV